MDYTIAYQSGKNVNDALIKLNQEVNNFISIGFEPIGGITIEKEIIYKEQYVNEYIACQALIKKN